VFQQPNVSRYWLRSTSRVPLDRRWVEPHEHAFDRFDLQLLRLDEDSGGEKLLATAIVTRVRAESALDPVWAVDSDPDSPLLVEVCQRALERDGAPREEIAYVVDALIAEVLVLDRIVFVSEGDDVPLLRGLLARGALDLLGTAITMMFLPPEDAALWKQAVAAEEVEGFVVAAGAVALPEFPFGGLVGG
jgi:hypothetical protein